MEYLPAILLTLGIIVVIVAAMLFGWRNQQRRHGNFAPPVPVPDKETLGQPLLEVEGQYVSTALAHDALTRVNAHTLGDRGNALIQVYPTGVAWFREGAENFFIPTQQLTGVRYSSGQSGKFVEKDGLVTVDWLLGQPPQFVPLAVQTGFRPRYAAEKKPLRDALAELTASPTKENNA